MKRILICMILLFILTLTFLQPEENLLTINAVPYGTGTPTSTAAMKLESTFTGWDFTEIWSIDTTGTINDGYPYLTGMAP